MEIRPAVVADAESTVRGEKKKKRGGASTVGGVRSSISQAGRSRARLSLAAVQDGEVIGWSWAALIGGVRSGQRGTRGCWCIPSIGGMAPGRSCWRRRTRI